MRSMKSKTLVSMVGAFARACFMAHSRSRRSASVGAASISTYVRYTGKQATTSRSARRRILCVKSAVRGFWCASRAASRASTLSSLAISWRMIWILHSRTIGGKARFSPVNSAYERVRPSSPAGSISSPSTRFANSYPVSPSTGQSSRSDSWCARIFSTTR